jgi:GNAT superfamily N-acetyltransferase
MDETEELIRLCARACVAMISEAPTFELRMTRNSVLALSGEPVADLNMLFVGPSPDAEDFLTQGLTRVRERQLPLLAMMSPHVAQRLAPVAEGLGLTAAGTAPLMVLRADTPVLPSRPCDIRRALGPELVRISGDLSSAAFSLPRDCVARCMDAGITETAGVETYVAWAEDVPMSAVTVTPAGTTAGIWSMATPPEQQGKGMGRALLTGVIVDYRRRGVERFFLIATEAGRPLYASLGFEVVADLSAWVLGHSTQVHS